jgi:hypothetical protein
MLFVVHAIDKKDILPVRISRWSRHSDFAVPIFQLVRSRSTSISRSLLMPLAWVG